ncbi:hypothetical protein [Ramlibacter albus]|uniref:SGNH/GDSL hydrolase family protein n=1 Tax=Ramlibacter albus TaxID=2079448 RepID=A0A923M8H0_9BURK|nr:hypothetical protein [Ramlibacter albus]MBC5764669.1 hypothetical protein [Ramlibacter albus]
MERILRHSCAWVVALLLGACGGGGGGTVASTGDAPAPVTATATTPTALPAAGISLLFMGNSHSSVNQLPAMVEAMVRAARPGTTVVAAEAPGWMYLEERSADAASLALLRSRAWSAVILQAQKYSTSGLFTYSTDGAEALIRETRAVGALPVLFPEWPRLGVDETRRIYDLHVSIAQRRPACVAPVGQAWDLALARHPGLVLHAADGNHSSAAGAFLAALVLASTYTRMAPDAVPFLPGLGVDATTQELLRHAAADTVTSISPRQWCPSDP